MIRTSKLLLSLAAAAACSGSASADLLIYEGFAYEPGDLSDNSTADSDLSAWSDTGSVIESGSIAYGTLPTTGNKVTMNDDTSWASIGTSLDGYKDDGDTLWFSVLVIPGTAGSNPDFGFALATDQGADSNNVPITSSGSGLGFRFKNSQIRATAWSAGLPTQVAGAGFTAGETYLVVGEIIFGTGGADDTVNIYLPGTDLAQPVAAASTVSANLDQSAFDTLTFMDKASNPRDQVDEIRFGETYLDVVPIPEPGSLALMALGGLMIARRRRNDA